MSFFAFFFLPCCSCAETLAAKVTTARSPMRKRMVGVRGTGCHIGLIRFERQRNINRFARDDIVMSGDLHRPKMLALTTENCQELICRNAFPEDDRVLDDVRAIGLVDDPTIAPAFEI